MKRQISAELSDFGKIAPIIFKYICKVFLFVNRQKNQPFYGHYRPLNM
jgi:hypothetical protein